MSSIDEVRADFDETARLVDPGESGTDRYDAFILSLIPEQAVRVLDVGCGLGRLTWAIAGDRREVVGVDLSSAMIDGARMVGQSERVSFHQGDFVNMDFGARSFDCIVSAAALQHMVLDVALARMANLLRPGGRLILRDLRRDASVGDVLRAYTAPVHTELGRFARSGRPLRPRRVRKAWARHGAKEVYLSFTEAQAVADRVFPGATVLNHWLWRYTIIWDKPSGDCRMPTSAHASPPTNRTRRP